MPESEGETGDRTPLYEAFYSDRYSRQEAIRDIQAVTGRSLLVYEANVWSSGSSMTEEDIQPFADLLYRVEKGSKVDLLLQSGGGNIDAAEKIVYMCRELAGEFRVLVPEYAKSAATLIALASDQVLMGLPSELGPIDAQLTGPGPGGAKFTTSAQSFLDEFEQIKKEVEQTGHLSPAYFPLLDGVNLGFIRMCRNLTERSKVFAEKWLKGYMLAEDPNKAEEVAASLCDAQRWLSHGRVIDAREAAKLGVKVKALEQHDDLWKRVWKLHCAYGVLFRKAGCLKVFESASVSLTFS